MEASKCPKCGEEPFYLEHVEKWYCYGCNSYIEEAQEEHVCAPEPAHPDNSECAAAIAKELKALDEESGIECKNCGATLQNLKDGRLYCFMCETYQDEVGPGPEVEKKGPANEAQALLDLAAPSVKAEEVHGHVEPTVEADQRAVVVDQEKHPEGPPVKQEPHAEVKACPSCGQPMKFIDKYQRHYCYGCRKYAPKEGAEPIQGVPPTSPEKKVCPECGNELKFIEKYNEHYCYACKKYPLRVSKKPAAEAHADPKLRSCTKCGGPLKFIEKYQRYYCYNCKEYAPREHGDAAVQAEKKSCPTCHSEMKFIPEYSEWYCYKCKKYSLRPSKPVLLL
jgi:hypothetical protein